MATRVETAEKKLQAAMEALKIAKSKEAEAQRKKETRKKIILGGRLMTLAETDPRAKEVLSVLMTGLSENEKKAFDA